MSTDRERRKEWVDTTCLECGVVTRRQPCFAGRKFCDRTCSNRYNWSQRGSRTAKVRDVSCPICSKRFRQANVSQSYCSPACGAEGRKESSRVWLKCGHCDGDYWRHRLRAHASKYCSDKCMKTERTERAAQRRATMALPEGMSHREYQSRLASQGGVCAICRRPETQRHHTGGVIRLTKDHDHATGAWRGLLCRRCNMALGLFDDDSELLKAAVFYVEQGGVPFVHAAS